ncbi:MAG TPA: hypothetical protein ACFYEA_07795 [Candidatus Tripitaka californicus]
MEYIDLGMLFNFSLIDGCSGATPLVPKADPPTQKMADFKSA